MLWPLLNNQLTYHLTIYQTGLFYMTKILFLFSAVTHRQISYHLNLCPSNLQHGLTYHSLICLGDNCHQHNHHQLAPSTLGKNKMRKYSAFHEFIRDSSFSLFFGIACGFFIDDILSFLKNLAS